MLVRLDFLVTAASSSAGGTQDAPLSNDGVVPVEAHSRPTHTPILGKRREACAAHQGGTYAAPCTPVG